MKTYLKISLLFVFTVLMLSCSDKTKERVSDNPALKNEYAHGFTIEETENGYLLKVYNPWQNAENIEYEYKLSRDDESADIKIPVKNIMCLSTTHLAYLNDLKHSDKIVAMSGTQYVYDADFRKKIEKGEVQELGFTQSLNAEKIVSMNPDVVFAFALSPSDLGVLQQLKEAGVPVVLVGEYLENHPLGKMEWLRFFATFFDDVKSADSIVFKRSENYNRLQAKINQKTNKPLVVLNTPWQGNWWTPGADSYMAKFIADAGGEYAFSELKGNVSQPVDMEKMMGKIQDADVWLNTGTATDKQAVFTMDKRLKAFENIENLKIYNNNKRSHAFGNDFFESAVVHPDKVLEDLIHIFYPSVLPEAQWYYYQELN